MEETIFEEMKKESDIHIYIYDYNLFQYDMLLYDYNLLWDFLRHQLSQGHSLPK